MKDWQLDEPPGGYTGKIVDGSGNTVAIVNNYEDARHIIGMLDALAEIEELADSYPEIPRHIAMARIYCITKHPIPTRNR